MKSLIGIFGGTFDPIHQGHLTIAQRLLVELPFIELYLVPCYLPVHRELPGANAVDRVAMLRLAIESLTAQPAIDTREIERAGPSYMIDTLASFKHDYPKQPLALIMGFDAWQGFLTWQRWQSIFELAHLILISRPGVSITTHGQLATLLQDRQVATADELLAHSAGKILVLSQFALPYSATLIRAALKTQRDLSDLLPPTVIHYIKSHNLYCQ